MKNNISLKEARSLFFKENTMMLFGDAKESVDAIAKAL